MCQIYARRFGQFCSKVFMTRAFSLALKDKSFSVNRHLVPCSWPWLDIPGIIACQKARLVKKRPNPNKKYHQVNESSGCRAESLTLDLTQVTKQTPLFTRKLMWPVSSNIHWSQQLAAPAAHQEAEPMQSCLFKQGSSHWGVTVDAVCLLHGKG